MEPAADERKSQLAMKWIDWDDSYSALRDRQDASDFVQTDDAPESLGPVDLTMARPFSVIELPADVDVTRSEARRCCPTE